MIRREMLRIRRKGGIYAPVYESHSFEIKYHVAKIRAIFKHIERLERNERERVREGKNLLASQSNVNRGKGFSKPG